MRRIAKLSRGLRRLPGFMAFCARSLRLALLHRSKAAAHNLLPAVEGTLPDTDGRLIVFAAADDAYLRRFGPLFVQSVRATSPEVKLHLHGFGAGINEMALAQRWQDLCCGSISWTWEQVPAATDIVGVDRAIYYQSMRFVRVGELVARGHRVLALDIDCVVRRDLHQCGVAAADADIGLLFRPKQLDPAKRVLASCFYAAPTLRGREYLAWLTNMVSHHLILARPSPKLDQIALYFAYLRYKRVLSVWRMPPSLSDWRRNADSLVWHAKGNRKGDPAFYGDELPEG